MKPDTGAHSTNHSAEPDDCPLCMEPLEIDDINFYPCTCGYQICRFCWHRIRTDENGLCPACRKAYPECPADFKPLTEEELQRIKNEKRQKDHQRKQKITDGRKHLASVRVVQKNLVFVVGLSQRLADTEVLKKQEYFGKFGRIVKVVINQNTSYAGSQGPSASAYVTYHRYEDALRAIQAVNNVHVDGRTLKASLGTTKYCSHFLKNSQCPKPDCMYLHELGDSAASFTKEDMQAGKHQEFEQKLTLEVVGGGVGSGSNHPTQPPPSITTPTTTTTTTAVAAVAPTPTETQPVPTQQQNQQSKQKANGGSSSEPTKKHSRGSRKKAAASSASPVSQSPPPTTNHPVTPPGQPDAVPGAAPPSITAVSPPPHDGTPPVSTNHTPSPGTPVANHMLEEASHSGLVAGANAQSDDIGVSSLTSVQSQRKHAPTSESRAKPPLQRSPFDDDEGAVPSSFFSTANGYMTQSILPSLVPAPGQQLRQSSDWSDGLILSNLPNNLLPVSSHTDWQAAFGFSPARKDLVNEDDLGFDPWNESNKGLADLLEKELQLGIAMTADCSKATPPPPGFTPNPANHGIANNDCGGSKMVNWLKLDRPAEESTPPGLGQPTKTTAAAFSNHSPPQFNHLPSHNQHSTKHPESVQSWQDGLRALLPNINISFGASNLSTQSSTTTTTSTTQKNSDIWPTQAWMVHDPAIISVNSHNTHTPGFTEEDQPHWLSSLQTLTDGDTPMPHPSASHLFPASTYANRGPSWMPQTTPPPGLRPPTKNPDTHTRTLAENHAV